MFSKKKDEQMEYEKSEPAVPMSPDVRRRKTSVIGPTLKFKGELSANEDLIIEGEIEGTIAHQDKNLTVGKEGRVKADINARTVEVYGKVDGDIHGEDIVKLAKSADVKGNIRCARIVMEDGAQFSGSIDMGQKTKAAAKPTSLPVGESAKQVESAG
jgi:cytoskeletal protein CcmA (bactofilin family)